MLGAAGDVLTGWAFGGAAGNVRGCTQARTGSLRCIQCTSLLDLPLVLPNAGLGLSHRRADLPRDFVAVDYSGLAAPRSFA